jgi:hypothetical protein
MNWRDRRNWNDRSPSPPPLKARPRSDDDGVSWDWYYNDPGGGTILTFGRFKGQALNDTGWDCLQWYRKKMKYQVSHPSNYGLRTTVDLREETAEVRKRV